MRRIAVLGASVTAQAANHKTGEVTGYAEYIRRLFLPKMQASTFVQFSYAGNRISDGGAVQAIAVAEYSPDFVVLELNIEDRSRGRSASDDEIFFAIKTACSCGAKPIFLMLPDQATKGPASQPDYKRLVNIAAMAGIPVIDVTIPAEVDAREILNGIHTTSAGGQFYGRVISEQMIPIMDRYDRNEIPLNLEALSSDLRWRRCEFKRDIKYRDLSLHLSAVEPTRVTVLQRQKIGKHSPVLGINFQGSSKNLSVWDPYCYYERASYIMLFDGNVDGSGVAHISCLDDDPLYASCRRAGETWPPPGDRYLHSLGDIYIITCSGSLTFSIDAK